MEYYVDPKEFFLEGNTVGVILVHGMTCTPSEMRGLGEYLNKQGFTVLAPLLSGHGTNYHDLESFDYTHWIDDIFATIDKLSESCDRIFVIGKSLGSLLAFYCGMKEKCIGVVMISPPMISPKFIIPLKFANKFLKFYKSGAGNMRGEYVLKDVNPAPYTVMYYATQPLKTLINVLLISKIVRKNLKNFAKPILVIQGRKDPLIPSNSGELIVNTVVSENKKLKIFENSYHDVQVESEREDVWKEIGEFISKNL